MADIQKNNDGFSLAAINAGKERHRESSGSLENEIALLRSLLDLLVQSENLPTTSKLSAIKSLSESVARLSDVESRTGVRDGRLLLKTTVLALGDQVANAAAAVIQKHVSEATYLTIVDELVEEITEVIVLASNESMDVRRFNRKRDT